MDTVLSILSFLWLFVAISLLFYYVILSAYTHKSSLRKIETQGGGVDKPTRKQIRDFNKSQLRSIKAALLKQSVLSVLFALGLYFKDQELLAVGFALLSLIKLHNSRSVKV